jgi:multiple sugar transport system permease protein
VILPFYLLFSSLNLLDTRISLIVVYLTFNLSFVVWLMKAFFDDLPRELDEAAMVDGCSRFQAFVRIILPLSKSGLSATTILCLITSWNEFLFAMILSGNSSRTLPVAITSFIQFTGTRWGELSAAATVMIAPLIIFGFFVQKRLVAGMTFGAIK